MLDGGYRADFELEKPEREEMKVVGLSCTCCQTEGMPPEILGWLTCSCLCSYTWVGVTEQWYPVHGREKQLRCRGKGLGEEGRLLNLWTLVKDCSWPGLIALNDS